MNIFGSHILTRDSLRDRAPIQPKMVTRDDTLYSTKCFRGLLFEYLFLESVDAEKQQMTSVAILAQVVRVSVPDRVR